MTGQPRAADFPTCAGLVLRGLFALELKVVAVARSGVLPRTSIRPPCLKNVARPAAMLWLVMPGPGFLPELLRLNCTEEGLRVRVALLGMEFPSVDSPLASNVLAGGGATYPWR